MNDRTKKYPWPASALTSNEMRMLYTARENRKKATSKHATISQLLAEAIRRTFAETEMPFNEAA